MPTSGIDSGVIVNYQNPENFGVAYLDHNSGTNFTPDVYRVRGRQAGGDADAGDDVQPDTEHGRDGKVRDQRDAGGAGGVRRRDAAAD